jgi:uncharacterized repeat protein (TIGR02543 family)
MNVKRFLAVGLAATMVLGNGVTAFAVEGEGSVEYDNSVDVSYDSITVPTLTGSKYNFTLDPRDELHTFDTVTYARESTEDNPGVYFHSQKTGGGAKIEKSDASGAVDIYKLEKKAVAADAEDWKAVVTGVKEDDDKTPTVTAGYYVWTPADFATGDYVAGTTTAGKKGVFTELDASNIKTYFEISEKETDDTYTITMKANHLAGNTVCDGKLYKDVYTKIDAAIQDNPPTVDLKDYVELETDGKSIKTVNGVYKEKSDGGYELAAKTDIKFTEAEIVYQNVTDKVVVVNKSTIKKTVKAEVTMSNIDGLSFNASDDFDGVKTASVFFKATDGTAANDAVLTKGETTATATYTLDVDGADVKSTQIKYQGGINTKTGGHNYFNYPAFGTEYNSNSFWIVGNANINDDDDSKAAWKAYGEALEAAYDENNAAATPKINIVYTVTDYQEAPSTYTVTFNTNGGSDEAAQTVTAGGNATEPATDPTKAGYNFGGWYADAEFTEEFDFENTAINEATTIYAKWDDPIEAYANYVGNQSNSFWIGVSSQAGFGTEPVVTSLVADGNVDLSEAAAITEYGTANKYWITVSWANASAAGLEAGNHTFVFCADGVWYTATYTYSG